jgi:hypothetical protein
MSHNLAGLVKKRIGDECEHGSLLPHRGMRSVDTLSSQLRDVVHERAVSHCCLTRWNPLTKSLQLRSASTMLVHKRVELLPRKVPPLRVGI